MIAYPDTSFLCALYVPQSASAIANARYQRMQEALHVSALLLFEFRQSVRFQIFRNCRDATQGYGSKVGMGALAGLQKNLEAGALQVVTADWAEVINRAERISVQRTVGFGCRFADVLHVATALHLGAAEFLTFDANQRRLAEAEGLTVQP